MIKTDDLKDFFSFKYCCFFYHVLYLQSATLREAKLRKTRSIERFFIVSPVESIFL